MGALQNLKDAFHLSDNKDTKEFFDRLDAAGKEVTSKYVNPAIDKVKDEFNDFKDGLLPASDDAKEQASGVDEKIEAEVYDRSHDTGIEVDVHDRSNDSGIEVPGPAVSQKQALREYMHQRQFTMINGEFYDCGNYDFGEPVEESMLDVKDIALDPDMEGFADKFAEQNIVIGPEGQMYQLDASTIDQLTQTYQKANTDYSTWLKHEIAYQNILQKENGMQSGVKDDISKIGRDKENAGVSNQPDGRAWPGANDGDYRVNPDDVQTTLDEVMNGTGRIKGEAGTVSRESMADALLPDAGSETEYDSQKSM